MNVHMCVEVVTTHYNHFLTIKCDAVDSDVHLVVKCTFCSISFRIQVVVGNREAVKRKLQVVSL